jgi:hypothetical protein
MDKQDIIIQLLTEIRDSQREEIAWRKKLVEESVRLQQVGVRRQLLGLAIAAIGGLLILVGGCVLLWALKR